MKRYLKSAIALLLIIVIALSTAAPVLALDSRALTYSTKSNSGQRDVVCTTLTGTSAASYYTGSYSYESLAALSSSSLLTTLRTYLTKTHTYKTSYAECKNYSDETDCQNNDKTVVLLYTSYVATMSDWISGSTGWNREHV